MALIKCPECGTDVSTLAPACPRCARPVDTMASQAALAALEERQNLPSPKKKKQRIGPLGALAILVAILVAAHALTPSKPTSTPAGQPTTPAMAHVGDHATMKALNSACRTRPEYERLQELSGDVQAFGRFLMNPINGCTELVGTVVVEDHAVFAGLMQVRKQGDPTSWWTSDKMVVP